MVIKAAGQNINSTFLNEIKDVKIEDGKVIVDSDSYQTGNKKVFAGGECISMTVCFFRHVILIRQQPDSESQTLFGMLIYISMTVCFFSSCHSDEGQNLRHFMRYRYLSAENNAINLEILKKFLKCRCG